MSVFLAALAAFQPTPIALETAGPWQVASTADGCVALRSFQGDDGMQIGFESSLSSPLPLLLLRGPSTQLPAGIGELAVSLNDAAPVTIHYGAFAGQDPHYRLLKLFPDKAALEALRAATSIRLEGSTMPPLPRHRHRHRPHKNGRVHFDQIDGVGRIPCPLSPGQARQDEHPTPAGVRRSALSGGSPPGGRFGAGDPVAEDRPRRCDHELQGRRLCGRAAECRKLRDRREGPIDPADRCGWAPHGQLCLPAHSLAASAVRDDGRLRSWA